uniref:Uncharacterized protein n=1 Tax=Arundo donax TaxID=35708 RepID=A0A0A9H8L5_ARUDO
MNGTRNYDAVFQALYHATKRCAHHLKFIIIFFTCKP